jgi:hypothetical protein
MKSAVLCTAVLAAAAAAGTIQLDLRFEENDVRISDFRSNHIVEIDGGMVAFDEGMPSLQGLTYTFVIPQGSTVTGAEVTGIERIPLGSGYRIDPVRTLVLGAEPVPDRYSEAVYLSASPFPSSPVTGIHNGNKSGFRLGSFTFVPFVYSPLSGELELITSARITLEYVDDPAVARLELTRFQTETAVSALECWIENPEMLDSWSPAVRTGGSDLEEWVVIATEAYMPALQPLADHREQSGMGVSMVTTEWICATYTGWDEPERIRNYLKESFEERGTVFALIVGDYYYQTPMTIRESDFICYGLYLGEASDLYYSDLDETWDGDGDHQYGEWEDQLDYYTDIYVGRFPAQAIGELEVMVDKTLQYETAPPSGDWRESAVLCGAWLWPEYGYNGDIQCDSIAAILPDDWNCDILLEDTTGANPDNQIDLMNEGVSFIEAVGHGNHSGVWWLEPVESMFTTGDISSMSNGYMLPVIQSIACHPANLVTNDCFAEWLLKWQYGGAVAAMFNSSYGLGNPPYSGPSEWLNIYFARHMFENGEYRVGVAHAVSKDMLLPTSVPRRRYCIQELILLADPCLYFVTAPEGSGGSQGPDPEFVRITSLHPNPSAGGTCSVSFEAPPGSEPVLRLFDLTGRVVMEERAGMVSGGGGSIDFTPETPEGYPLATGCYLVTLSTGQSADTSRLVLIR